MSKKGLFITVEGNEGSGKTTVVKRVLERLQKEKYNVTFSREPGGNRIAESIRNIILDRSNTEMDPKTEALLYAAARRQHLVQNILPLIDQGTTILCDRYIDSSLAYQGYARGIGIKEVFNINMFAIDNKLPDLTILFEIQPEIGLKRIAQNEGREINRLDVEDIDFHHRVHMGYMLLSERFSKRIVVVNAERPIDEVEEDVYNIIKQKIDSNK
ncbi:MAG: dTMP kinase [Bacilli bacterium]|nr:dTMP kinase [Bacilli bacterium]